MVKKSADIMGMPVRIVIIDSNGREEDIEEVFNYLRFVDKTFSPYQPTSELAKINRNEIDKKNYSEEMRKVLLLAEKTKKDTNGYFDIRKPEGTLDPSGIVKGYAIYESAKLLSEMGMENFYIEIAGDIEVTGLNNEKKSWRVGIENPFNRREIIKVVYLSNKGIATSGTYIRGHHIYNPLVKREVNEIVSVTVIADNIYDADRFATAAFAMGKEGITFIEKQKGSEGYMVLKNKTAIMTSGFEEYTSI